MQSDGTIKFTYNSFSSTQVSFEVDLGQNVLIGEFREAAEVQLGLRNPQSYKLVLERNGRHLRILDNNNTFAQEGIFQGDNLVFFPLDNLPDSLLLSGDLTTYKVTLVDTRNQKVGDYSISLNLECENNPRILYFDSTHINGGLKFIKYLQAKLMIELPDEKIADIIYVWSEDISQGFIDTTVQVNVNGQDFNSYESETNTSELYEELKPAQNNTKQDIAFLTKRRKRKEQQIEKLEVKILELTGQVGREEEIKQLESTLDQIENDVLSISKEISISYETDKPQSNL